MNYTYETASAALMKQFSVCPNAANSWNQPYTNLRDIKYD